MPIPTLLRGASMTFSRIAGTGGYLPERVMTNHELESIVDTSDEWIRDRSGICQRHIAADGEMTSDMALAAATSTSCPPSTTPAAPRTTVAATSRSSMATPSGCDSSAARSTIPVGRRLTTTTTRPIHRWRPSTTRRDRSHLFAGNERGRAARPSPFFCLVGREVLHRQVAHYLT